VSVKATKFPTAADNLVDVPAVPAYRAAFLACRGKLMTEKQLALLKSNYNAPHHTITPAALAAQVGFQTYSAANLQYGKYAAQLCSALRVTPRFQLSVLVTFAPGEQPGDEFMHWTMVENAARALEQLGWVKRQHAAE
jgi:hypothetical protein